MERAMSIGLLVLVSLLAGLFLGRVALRVWSPGEAQVQAAGLVGAPSEDFVGPCVVDFVVDGDTVAVQCGDVPALIDLAGSDAPEPGERGFAEAGRALRELTSAGRVWLSLYTSLGNAGEAEAWVYGEDGRELNTEMVRLGWSVYDVHPLPTGEAPDLARAEIEARVHRRGIWAP
jgi:endonuclease YncB( thermonuclease family)